MKILVFAIIASMAIAVIASISLFTLHENRSPCTFCPMIPSQPLANTSSIQNASTEINQTITSISNIIIPAGAEDPSSGKNYEPRYLVVVLGVNNTVKWTNESPSAAHTIVADNHDDPLFWNITRSANSMLLLPGKSFNFTFTKVGEFQYDTEPHPWMYGWVLALPQSTENAIQTVTLNASSGVPDPCETFRMPCPLHSSNYNFTAQRFGSDIYIEKVTGDGVDNYAVIKPNKTCYYPPTYANSCTNPDDLAILRLVGVDTSIPQENVHVAISGLASSYIVGEPIDFEISIKGFGHCDIPSVLVTHQGYIDWQSKTSWPSDTTPCETGMHDIDKKYDIEYLGGPFSINQTGTYTIHVDYASNSTEVMFNVIPKTFTKANNSTGENNQSQSLTNMEETGTIRLQNGTYDFLVLNATMKGYHNPPLQTMFDGVQFTLLPGPWSGGPPGGCGGTPFRAEAKASDGLYIPLDVFVPDEPCIMNLTTTSLGWHKDLGAGLTINHGNLMILVSKGQNDSSAEKIRIIPEYPITTGINKNGTITESETIEILFDNFKQNLPLVIQIFNPHGGFYKVDTIFPNEIQSDGFYKYQIYLKGNESDMGKYNVVITHGNAIASTSAYLSNAVP